MNAVEALKTARAAGIDLTIDGDDLRLRAAAPPPPAVLDLLAQHKASIVRLLRSGGEDWPAEDCSVLIDATAGNGEPTPVLLSDGRRLHRFRADRIPASVPDHVVALCDQARWRGVVLVADGRELIAVEPRRSSMLPDALRELRDAAGAIIACLRGEARARCTRKEDPYNG